MEKELSSFKLFDGSCIFAEELDLESPKVFKWEKEVEIDRERLMISVNDPKDNPLNGDNNVNYKHKLFLTKSDPVISLREKIANLVSCFYNSSLTLALENSFYIKDLD
jgi:hypothetical protein